ncbi:MAG: PKD domain-containing protein, partial [Acidimicrobiia bacterium]
MSTILILLNVMVFTPSSFAATRGEQANGHSNNPSISADGRYVAFSTEANNLVDGDTNGTWDYFLRDRSTGETRRVSVSSVGVQGNCGTDAGSNEVIALSSNGSHSAFRSCASNLVGGDTNNAEDIFVHDRVSGTTSRESVGSSGQQITGVSGDTAISGDGRYVLFASSDPNVVLGDTNGTHDVFLRDRMTSTTILVSRASAGAQGDGASFVNGMSPDGRYVLISSYASNLVAGDTNGVADVFVRDLVTGITERVSVSSSEEQTSSCCASDDAQISDDGRFVVFESGAGNLVAGDSNLVQDIFLRDRQAGTTTAVTVGTSGEIGNENSFDPYISGNGQVVSFMSRASNLVSGDANGLGDIFVRDLVFGKTIKVTDGLAGAQPSTESYLPMTRDGRLVSFASDANNLVANDTNGWRDVFVADVVARSLNRESVGWKNGPPTASISATPAQGDTNTTFSATVSASDPDGDAISYSLDWGDGVTTNSQSGTHRYLAAGDYVVTGTAFDQFGGTTSASTTVRVCAVSAGGVCAGPSGGDDVQGAVEDVAPGASSALYTGVSAFNTPACAGQWQSATTGNCTHPDRNDGLEDSFEPLDAEYSALAGAT